MAGDLHAFSYITLMEKHYMLKLKVSDLIETDCLSKCLGQGSPTSGSGTAEWAVRKSFCTGPQCDSEKLQFY